MHVAIAVAITIGWRTEGQPGELGRPPEGDAGTSELFLSSASTWARKSCRAGAFTETAHGPKKITTTTQLLRMRGLYEAPTDYTKTRQTVQSLNRLYKAPTDNTKTQNIRQNLKILDQHPTYSTTVANNNILT